MSKNFIVDTKNYIEVKCHFVEEEKIINNGNKEEKSIVRIYIPSEVFEQMSKEDFEGENFKDKKLSYAIGSFRKPTYKNYYIIKTKSITIDTRTKILYTHPARLENEIINTLLFAIQDDSGNRTDITNENKVEYIGNIDPTVINGLVKEFMKNCGVDFID